MEIFPEIEPEQFIEPDIVEPEIVIQEPLFKQFGEPLPKGVLPRHVIPVNQSFAYTIPEDSHNRFYSFRWLKTPPKGMYFHYDTRSILWVPDETNLGAYNLAYHVEMKIGEYITLGDGEEDSLETYKVVPILEGYDERLWIYVNDPPVFISEPEQTELMAESRFYYLPLVKDRNIDAVQNYYLEVYPPGMEFLGDTLSWQTDSTFTAPADIRMVVSDGFDRSSQEFKLYPLAGITILSDPVGFAEANEPYTYQVESYIQETTYDRKYELLEAPDNMTISPEGLVNWIPNETQVDTQSFRIVAHHGMATDTQQVKVHVNHPPIIVKAPPAMNKIDMGYVWDFKLDVFDPNRNDELVYTAIELPVGMRMDPYNGRLRWEPSRDNADFSNLKIEVTDGHDTRTIEAGFFVNTPIDVVSLPPMFAAVGEEYNYEIVTSDLNQGTLLPFDEIVPIDDVRSVKLYSVHVTDDIYWENIDRYIGDWNSASEIYVSDSNNENEDQVSRINLKKYVDHIFKEKDRLYLVVRTIDGRTVLIKDILWEFFQGSSGKPPRVVVEKQSLVRYTLLEFPDGMVVDELSGTIKWTPHSTQVDRHKVMVMVSDGYTKDEQSFEVFVNDPPVIISNPLDAGLVGEIYKYQVQVEDKNQNPVLQYELVRAPKGMQVDAKGTITWTPEPAQINTHVFEVKVSDGYAEDIQTNQVFINMSPTIISTPKPVALTGHEYKYRAVVEDLNKDKVSYRPLRLPKYARFNGKTGMLYWKPRNNQRGPNDVIIMAIDDRGATTVHEFQIHVFEDPSARQFVNTGWPMMLTFIGIMFAWGISQI